MLTAVPDLWDALEATDLRAEIRPLLAAAEARRAAAEYNTGSIAEDEACALLALARLVEATVVIEVGTFVGLSTTALAAAETVEAVYTCDVSNDCLPSTAVIRTYPKQRSLDMLRDLLHRHVRADLCFIDGTLSVLDVAVLVQLTHARTVFAFHDYNHGPKIRPGGRLETMPRKGIGNVQILAPHLHDHVLVKPRPHNVLAFLVPR